MTPTGSRNWPPLRSSADVASPSVPVVKMARSGEDLDASDRCHRAGLGVLCDPLPMAERPSGTVTFLFTDIEGSTRLWQDHPAEMQAALERHDEILRSVIDKRGGHVFSSAGDGLGVAFASAADAVAAAEDAQDLLRSESWPNPTQVWVRMGLHMGDAQERDGGYFGLEVNKAARIMAAGHGGQVLASSALSRELGLDSMTSLGVHRLKDLSSDEELFQVGFERFPVLRTLEPTLHNLPIMGTQMLGRDDELKLVLEAIRSSRLVTLTGVGGMGKTTLALAAAAELVAEHADGVWFVDMASLAHSGEVPVAVADAAGVRLLDSADPSAKLAELVTDHDMLFLLDNCEHVIDGVADLVEALITQATAPRVLATSREPIELVGETVMAIPPLESTGVDSPAVQLFETQADRLGIQLTRTDRGRASDLCSELDGLPLAIELAAGQLVQLSFTELVDRLDQRFELLRGGRGRRRERHHSLELVMTDTWAQLTDDERTLLEALAAFPSSFDLETVESIGGANSMPAPAVALRGLVARSLVSTVHSGDDSLYRLLETVKLFCRRRWNPGTEARFRQQHLDWLEGVVTATSSERQLSNSEFAFWYWRHSPDLRAGCDYAAVVGRDDVAAVLLAAGTLCWSYRRDGRCVDAIRRMRPLLARSDLSPAVQARLHLSFACALVTAGEHHETQTHADKAVALAEQLGDPALLSYSLTVSTWFRGLSDGEWALGVLGRARDIATSFGSTGLVREADIYRGMFTFLVGREADAVEIAQGLADGSTNSYEFGLGHQNVGAMTIVEDPQRSAQAFHLFSEAMDREEDLADWTITLLVAVGAALHGDLDDVGPALTRTLRLVRRTGADDGLPDLLLLPAALAYRLGRLEQVAELLGAIRYGGRPTHNFNTTLVYQSLRRAVTPKKPDGLPIDLEEVFTTGCQMLLEDFAILIDRS